MQAEELGGYLWAFRRGIIREGLLSAVRSLGEADFSLTQVAALMLLEDGHERTIKQIGDALGRSLSATSRVVDQLVRKGLARRREDEQDRRARRAAITPEGRAFVGGIERRRAEAQLAVMAYLTPEEQIAVMRAMRLLADAARRRKDGDQNPVARPPA